MTLAAGTKLGPYEILSPLGAGGMGEVYRAKDPRLGRDVAIKVLPPSFAQDADRLRRFEQEAKAAGVLNHPNLTAVHDIGSHEGAPYVVQELLEGETLRAALAGGRLSARKAIDYSLQIAHGLAAAHEKGIVHRDLKPENLFVTSDGRVKILDFGLAKLTHVEEGGPATNLPTATAGTEPGVVLGTLGYMSPEQIKGRAADARSDIFSFGAILYEMLSGRRAFHGDSAGETMAAILKEDPPDLSVTNQNISPGLERIVRHCLEKNPEQRFHSAHDLAFDLEALSGVSASALTGAKAAGSSVGRGRAFALAGAAALALLALAAGYALGHRGPADAPPAAVVYTQLTYRQEPIFNARFSPDGKTIVYSAAPTGSAPQIYTLRPDYPGTSPPGQPEMTLLSISSKGELAVLTHPQYLRHSVFFGTLARMPLEGGAPREIVNAVREADWAPDGSDLAIIHDVDGHDRLEFPIGKVLAETGGYFSNPRFSRHGDAIAFFEHPLRFDDRGSVCVVDLAGHKKVLSEGYAAEEGLAWSSDGREILFSGGASYSDFAIYAVTPEGKRRNAVQSAGGLTILDVAPDGRWIVSRDDQWREIPTLGAGQERERNLAWLEQGYCVAITPDGKTLLFTEESSRVGKSYSTCLRQTDGSPVVRLGDGAAGDITADGKLVLSIVPTDPAQLVLYSTGAGQPRKLDRGGLVAYESAVFFPDGRRILACGHEAGHAVRCYVQDVEGGKPRALTPEGTTDGLVSPDGLQVLVRDSGGNLKIYPVDGAAPRAVAGSTPGDAVGRWSADGKSLLVSDYFASVPLQIERLDLATGRREPYRQLGPADPVGAVQIYPIALSADGRSYAYSLRRMTSHLFLASGAR
jgi:eukaryotic-like serine/threonine-protein kinase